MTPSNSQSEGAIALIDRWHQRARGGGWDVSGNGGSAVAAAQAPPGP